MTGNARLAAYASLNDERFDEFRDTIRYFEDWKKEVEALPIKDSETKKKMLPSSQTMQSIILSAHSIPAAIKFLLRAGTKYILARVFCQDPKEQHFSKHRAALGGKSNPTVDDYERTENLLHLQGNLGFKRRRTNTEHDNKLTAEDCTPLPKRQKIARRSLNTTFTKILSSRVTEN